MYSLHHHGQWCGMIYLIMGKDMVYIFYLAIDSSQRGRGLGKLAMKALLDRYPQHRVFLALEDWHDTAADNRHIRIFGREFITVDIRIDFPAVVGLGVNRKRSLGRHFNPHTEG